MIATMSWPAPDGDGLRYCALPHRGRDGWYVLDRRTNRVAVVDDRPQTGLSARSAGMLAATLNAAAAVPAERRH